MFFFTKRDIFCYAYSTFWRKTSKELLAFKPQISYNNKNKENGIF